MKPSRLQKGVLIQNQFACRTGKEATQGIRYTPLLMLARAWIKMTIGPLVLHLLGFKQP